MLVLWGRMTSINVQKAVFALGETGVPYERREAGGAFGVVGTPEYRALNPNGLVPTLEDDGLVLWESNAIVRYLSAQYGDGRLWPADARARAHADRWADWQQTTLGPAMGPAFMNLVRTAPEARDMAAVEASREKTETVLAVLDARLATAPWLGGEAFGYADVILAPSVHRWLNMPVARRPHAALERWYAAIRARPASSAALPLPVA
jgi:glutathione S-transferase